MRRVTAGMMEGQGTDHLIRQMCTIARRGGLLVHSFPVPDSASSCGCHDDQRWVVGV